MLRKILLGLVLGWAIGAAQAQTPSPANVGIVSGTPDIFKVLDHTGAWATFGTVDPVTHIFTPAGGGGGGGTPSFPQTVIGGVSGGIPYFSSTTTLSASPLLQLNAFMLGGGAGAAPKTTATGTGVVTAVGNATNAASGLATVNGAITIGDCLKWGPGVTDAGACGSGGGGGSLSVTDGSNTVSGATSLMFNGGSISGTTPNAVVTISGGGGGGGGQTNFATHAALISSTTAFSTGTLMQQGFYAIGDGGAAFYDWNATSYCANGTSGSPMAADGYVCILPSAQAASTPGRYLVRLTNGQFNARSLGFRSDGVDNANQIAVLNNLVTQYQTPTLIFTSSPSSNETTNYWFTQPLHPIFNLNIICDSGLRSGHLAPAVNLAFTPGVDGVQQDDYTNAIWAGISGCGINAAGDYGEGVTSVAGTNTITAPQMRERFLGAGSTSPLGPPSWAVGDGILAFTYAAVVWEFNGSITGDVLTVTGPITGSGSTDCGIQSGQLLLGAAGGNPPFGLYIQSQLTGTACQAGTYQLNYSIASPPIGSQATPGTISGTYYAYPPNNVPTLPIGSTITSCTGGTQCTLGGTLTTSANWLRGAPAFMYLLPGPNSNQGDQSYHVTTNLTGHTFGPITAGISDGSGGSGNILSVTAGAGSLQPGQMVVGTGGSPITKTTAAAMHVGDYNNISVSSCSGVTSGMFVVGFSGGNSVFPFQTLVSSCIGTTLTITNSYGTIPTGGVTQTTSGSPVVTFSAQNPNTPYAFWKGMPVNGANFTAPTTVISAKVEPWNSSWVDVTLSTNATATGSDTLFFGGAQFAAPSGTTLTFLNGSATIDFQGTGTGGNGTYTLDSSVLLAPGSTVYAYDSPWTAYVTQGPRAIRTSDFIASDAFPYGTVGFDVYYTSNNQQTVVMAQTVGAAYWVAAQTAHAGGSGRMWVLPSGIWRPTSGNSFGNFVNGFAGAGINMPCGGGYPETGCGRSEDSNNMFYNNGVGRVVSGDNSGGGASTFNEYDHNWTADVFEVAGVGTSYIGEMVQGQDESTNTHDVTVACGTNGSTFNGVYASGAQWESSCAGPGTGAMLSVETVTNESGGVPWYGPVYQWPYDAVYGGFQIPFPVQAFGNFSKGAIPYVASDNYIRSTATLTQNGLIVGGGASAAPASTPTGLGVLPALGAAAGQANGIAVMGVSLQNGVTTLSGGTATLTLNGPLHGAPTCLTADQTTPANNSYAVETIAGWTGTASASSTYIPPIAAFPNEVGYPTQGWGSNGVIPAWLEYDFGASTFAVTEYAIARSSLQPTGWLDRNAPTDWTFEGSNNNSTWTVLDTETAQSVLIDHGSYVYDFSNSTTYRYYRINISAAASGNAGYVNITTLNMLAAGLGEASVVVHGTGSDIIKYICAGQ